jgi:hypothetical protein
VAICKHRPCWGTPQEIAVLIEKGFGDRMMLDWWAGDETDHNDIYIICPAVSGYEGQRSPFFPTGVCSLLENDLCMVHDWKPTEGRENFGCKDTPQSQTHKEVAMTWNTDEGREVVRVWEELHNPTEGDDPMNMIVDLLKLVTGKGEFDV